MSTCHVCRKRAGSAQMSVRLPAGCNAFLCPFSMSRNDPSNTEPGFRLLNYVCTTIALAKPKTEFTGWCVLISHLDCIHDTIGEDGHLSCNRLHSLFELCNVRARGKHVVQAWGSSWGRRIEGWVQKSCNCGSRKISSHMIHHQLFLMVGLVLTIQQLLIVTYVT